MTKLTALFLLCLTIRQAFTSEPVPFTVNTKKFSHVLDDHFISITVNPTDLLQGKVYGLAMNSTMAILKGLAPAYVRIGSPDTFKYTFKRNRYPNDMVKPEDEYTVTETHWMVFNEVAQSAGLDVIVCLNPAHRTEGTKKWDTRNSLELISFSDSQGYNLTWQLGYEVQSGDDLSGVQFGKDLNRLRTILNAFPRYQSAKLIGPDIRVIHKKEDVDFWNDVLYEAGPTLDAITWHPRWPQPSKMKVSENSELGYEFPVDYLEWDRAQLGKILQKSIFKNSVWIGETKRESTGTFAEGLMWARRLVLAAKLGIEVVMKQPNLMDISHPKPEYWIALLHKRLLGKSVLETRSVTNNTDLAVISHCTNPFYWVDKPEKLHDGAITVFGVNMRGLEQKVQIKGTWTGRSQLLFQYVLTSGSDPDSVFSQMTYLNGEPLMMTDDGMLPDIVPRVRKLERGLTMKLPPYSIGFWVVPEAKVKICQTQPVSTSAINIETLTPSKSAQKNLENIQDINQFLVEKLKNPEGESQETTPEMKIELASSESSEKEMSMKENALPRVARRIRQAGQINEELKSIIEETQGLLTQPEKIHKLNLNLPKATPTMERRIQSLADGISKAIKTTNQEQEFDKFLTESGLGTDFGTLLMNDRKYSAPGARELQMFRDSQKPDETQEKRRLKRSLTEDVPSEDVINSKFGTKITLVDENEEENKNRKPDLVIPHQPDLKGLEERYKFIIQSTIQDGKRKIDDIKRKVKQEESEITHKIKSPETVSDIQEEIIKKEIELLEKTEETVADIFKTQKKRQETFEDIIFDELNDVKGERMSALEEMHRSQRKKENTIVKRQVQTPLSRPLLKTVEYIEKNFNLEPESVRKIKRSLEEKMGEILRNYDTKKSAETKKRFAPQKEEKKIIMRKSIREDNRQSNEYSSDDKDKVEKSSGSTKDKLKERNTPRRTTLTSTKTGKSSTSIKTEELAKKKEEEEQEGDSFEFFNEKKPIEIIKKPDRRRSSNEDREVSRIARKESRSASKEETKLRKSIKENTESDLKKKRKVIADEIEEKKVEEVEEEPEEKQDEKPVKLIPLKNDKERREHMLKQITSMVDNMNSLERGSGRSKRKDVDEDISEEFDLDRRSRKIKRWPRKAEVSEFQIQGASQHSGDDVEEKLDIFEEVQPTTTPTPTTPSTKLSKLRKIRVRPTRKPKPSLLKEDEDTPQRKRHLASFEKPLLDLEKKKLLKPKLRKFSPKLLRHGNELPSKEQQLLEIPAEVEMAKETPVPEPSPSPIPQPNEELLKDLQHIAEEKIFLDHGSETLKEMSETSGKKSSEVEDTAGINFSGETPAPTEGYIIVEPTMDTGEDENEKTMMTEKPKTNKDEELIQVGYFPQMKESVEEEKVNQKQEEPEQFKLEEETNELKKQSETEKVKNSQTSTKEISSELVQDTVEEASSEIIPNETLLSKSQEPKNEKRNDEEVNKPPLPMDKLMEEQTEEDSSMEMEDPTNTKNQRKRRATFLTAHAEDDDEEDYSSEERIQKFKQMIYKKSPSKRPSKNEIRPTGGSGGGGMGADEFLRMAGSTVRVMFDDVIPEAYGQTKTKIQNMGISEYIKEFGKIVQQMKNLDQIFLNIGEAAVKGYIKGNKAEKGPYIQVISRKKRELDDETFYKQQYYMTEVESTTDVQPTPKLDGTVEPSEAKVESTPLTSVSSMFQITVKPDMEPKPTDIQRYEEEDFVGKTYARTSTPTEEITSDKRGYGWSSDILGQGIGKDIQGKTEKETWKTEKESKTPMEETLTTEYPTKVSSGKANLDLGPKSQDLDPPKKNDKTYYPIVVKEPKAYKTNDLQDTISPWIKTTKDFIKQALTTLRRQRELSEILARESLNDDAKILGKREADENFKPELPVYFTSSPEDEGEVKDEEEGDLSPFPIDTKTQPKLIKREADEASRPVYRMIKPSSNKKREAYQKRKDESLIRHLRGLQPGVYVVPTEEMTNIRSEQITNEAKQKSGMPNVVTLNIYYDKKKESSGKDETTDKTSEPKFQQDTVTYYQNRAWNTAGSDYDPNTQYLSTFPEVNLPPPVITPVQVTPELQTSQVYAQRFGELPNSRLIQYGPPTYTHYTPVQKVYPSVVSRNSQPYYGPVMYLPQENRFIPQPPGTKRQWNEFKARGVPSLGSGWNLQYETVPGSLKSSLKNSLSSYNKNFKLFSDKKRSIGGSKMDPTWSESALPFWKFFATSSSEKIDDDKPETEDKVDTENSAETESSEALFAENRKRAKQAEERKNQVNSVETVTEDKELETKDRRRRSLPDNTKNDLLTAEEGKKLEKRSYPYDVEFRDHDILPEWFGTYQEFGNALDDLPPHVRRSQIVSTPWSDEDELLSILEADDELTLVDLNGDDDDYYYANDNTIGRLKRYPRSTDQSESSMLKTNMIYKMPMDNDLLKHKISAKTGMKRLTGEDSSLELVTKSKIDETGTTQEEKKPRVLESQQPGVTQPPSSLQLTTHGALLSQNQHQPPQNETEMKPRNPNDDTFYYFFKYAYDSLVKVMKSMTELF